jgi:hypothetical protein
MEVQFLEEQPGENNDRWIVMESTGANGTVRRSRVLFRPTDLGWRQVVDNNGNIVQQPITDQP